MENREDLRSILPFLPLKLESSTLVWPNQVIEVLKSLSKGPTHSRVDSGEVLFLAISDLRNSLSLSSHPFAFSTAHGYSRFFDEFLSRSEAAKWFEEVVPVIANLLLRLPTLLESHYQYADHVLTGVGACLRLLESQQPGIVFLSQELIAALLSCSLFCLFPTANRGVKQLPMINFDHLFASLCKSSSEKQKNKIQCIIHYFERISSCMPLGYVSFERKVIPLEHNHPLVTYPTADNWANSVVPLSRFEVSLSGLIEDQSVGAIEVDFANRYLGGGALRRGCVQEEIRFMINPELIVGILFLPSMSDNEAIEIVGVERFSNYTGYAATFRYSGNHVDEREVDSLGRRVTTIVAIDALRSPGSRQYRLDYILREANKAFCGFLNQPIRYENSVVEPINISETQSTSLEDCMNSRETESRGHLMKENERDDMLLLDHSQVGIVTGNWGCGAYGGDPEVKAVVQWLAASQALRPFILHYTFGVEQLQNLDQECEWILSQKWTVGELWDMLVDYGSKRVKGETTLGFFSWLHPSFDPRHP